MSDITLGASLRQARDARRLKGSEVAEKLGMSSPAYLRYERDEVDPSGQTLLKLAEIYGCSLDALMRGGGSQNEQGNNETEMAFKMQGGQVFKLQMNINGYVVEAENAEREPYIPNVKDRRIKQKTTKLKRATG